MVDVRKQYHFWPGERGLDAWDVDRLIRLSADLPVVELPLDSLSDVDSRYWSSDHGGATVRWVVEHARLMADADLRWPIILGRDGRVMDGMHRVARALFDGLDTIRAVQFATDVEPDFKDCRPDDLSYD